MPDTCVNVIVGSRPDASSRKFIADGFATLPLLAAAKCADILFILVPDEIRLAVYKNYIKPGPCAEDMFSSVSSYNIYFKKSVSPAHVDVIMLALRMVR